MNQTNRQDGPFWGMISNQAWQLWLQLGGLSSKHSLDECWAIAAEFNMKKRQ